MADNSLWKKSEDGSVWAPLFATAREIHNEVAYGDQPSGMSKDALMTKKAMEADRTPTPPKTEMRADLNEKYPGHYGGLTNMIKEHGYDWDKPVEVHNDFTGATELREGHHRVAVMMRDRPDEFIPIKSTYDGAPSHSEKLLDEHFFNDLVRRQGPEEAKQQMPLKHYPWLEHLHNQHP